MFELLITGCTQQDKNVSSLSKVSSQEVVVPSSPNNENLSGTIQDTGIVGDDSSAISRPINAEIAEKEAINVDIDWKTLEASYNPPKIDGLLQAINHSQISADGSVIITPDIKREFNKMGEDYRFFFMPKVIWYKFGSIAYEPTGEALVYILYTWTGKFGTFPEKAPKYEAEARLRKIFAAPNDEYPLLKHQNYGKCVMFDGEAYRPWPESYNASTMIYNLTDLRVRKDEGYTYYTATANEYQFDLTNGGYTPGENEIFLFDKAKVLKLDYSTTLLKLLETGEITKAVKSRNYTIEFRIKGDSTLPKIVSVDKV